MTDAKEILGIYSPYILNTAVTFETEIPSLEQFEKRMENICEKYPYLVYLIDGKIIAYAYASQYNERGAYQYDADVSIYVAEKYHGIGIGGRLYGALFEILKFLGYRNAYACCTASNEKSIGFHKSQGFEPIGVFHNAGYKLGEWHDMMWLEKSLLPYSCQPEKIKSVSDVSSKQPIIKF